MHFKKLNGGYAVSIQKGEEIITELNKFCAQNNVKSGSISGIGATNNVSIAYLNLETNEYAVKDFADADYEIVSLLGNISWLDDKPIIHLHITIGDSNYNLFGGHLKSAIISVTGEIFITMASDELNRKFDKETGLNLLDL